VTNPTLVDTIISDDSDPKNPVYYWQLNIYTELGTTKTITGPADCNLVEEALQPPTSGL